MTAGQTLQGSGANAGVAYTMLYTDHLGTVQLALGANGNLAWRGYAQAFGKTQVDPASSVTMNLRFAGQYFDAETGTHYNWMRDYDPATGRYRQGDPIGLNGGINLYNYTQNNPIGSVDPYGLTQICFVWGGCFDTSPPPIRDPDFPPGWGPNHPIDGPVFPMPDLPKPRLPPIISIPFDIIQHVFNAPVPPVPGAVPDPDVPVTGKGVRQWNKPGDFDAANDDFDKMNPSNVENKGGGVRVGTLPNGDRVNVRPRSRAASDGVVRPTIEIQRPDGKRAKDKIRYCD